MPRIYVIGALWGGIKWTWNYDRDTLPVILQKITKRTKIKKVKA